LGVTWNPNRRMTWFASFSQGMRVPAPVELTCADPSAPCVLPAQFLADPPLKPVIARTVELGTQLRPSADVRASASVYRSVLSDDIQFVSSGSAVNAGFFQNSGGTLRQGVDLTASARSGKFSFAAAYSYVRAEYLSGFTILSPNNSTADPTTHEIQVERGARIPTIPRSMLKLVVDWMAAPRASLGFGWAWFDRQYARGDENNRDVHGPLASYGVAQAFARYRPSRRWELSLKIDNLFNRTYRSFGVLGRNFFTGPGATFNPVAATPEQFLAPGAPRAAWITLRYETDRRDAD
jgi:outer membrane receptor protein involved in Fe transport